MKLDELNQQAKRWNIWADSYDEWAGHLDGEVPARFLAPLAGSGVALELGVGTGLVALEMAKAGVSVVGVDISDEMLAKLAAKSNGLPVKGVRSDMSSLVEVRQMGPFQLIYSVNSSIFGLLTQERQLECFEQVASHLTADGHFVVHTMSPSPRYTLSPRRQLNPVSILDDGVQLSMTDVDMATQRISYRELIVREDGISVLPVEARYMWPSEMDMMARLAGLALADRFGDWSRSQFRASSPMVVSVYSKAS